MAIQLLPSQDLPGVVFSKPHISPPPDLLIPPPWGEVSLTPSVAAEILQPSLIQKGLVQLSCPSFRLGLFTFLPSLCAVSSLCIRCLGFPAAFPIPGLDCPTRNHKLADCKKTLEGSGDSDSGFWICIPSGQAHCRGLKATDRPSPRHTFSSALRGGKCYCFGEGR